MLCPTQQLWSGQLLPWALTTAQSFFEICLVCTGTWVAYMMRTITTASFRLSDLQGWYNCLLILPLDGIFSWKFNILVWKGEQLRSCHLFSCGLPCRHSSDSPGLRSSVGFPQLPSVTIKIIHSTTRKMNPGVLLKGRIHQNPATYYLACISPVQWGATVMILFPGVSTQTPNPTVFDMFGYYL